jgi:MFS family permease
MSTVPHTAPSTPSVSAISPFDVPAFRALLWAQACFGVAFSTFLILPKFLAVNLGAGPAQVGWIMATASLANVLTVRPVALVATHWGPRRTLALASLCMAAGALGFTIVSSVGPLAYFCRVLQGMGWAFMFSASGSLVLALAPPGRLSQAIALHGSANLLSNAIGPALAEPGIVLLGPAPVFAAAAAVAVLGAWLCSRIQGEPSVRPVPAPGPRPNVRDSLPRFLLFVGATVGIGSGTMLTFHQPLALERGIDRISAFLVAYTVGAVGVRLAFGKVIDRVGARRVASGSFIVYGVVVAAMVAMRPGSLAIYGALFGVAHGLFWPSFLALALQTAPAQIRDRTLAWVNASYNAGVVSVAALGIVAEHAGFALVFVPVGVLVTATGLALRRR